MIEGTFSLTEERGGGTLHISSQGDWIETKSKRSGTYDVVSSSTESGSTLVRVKYDDDDERRYAVLKQNKWTGKIYASSWPPVKECPSIVSDDERLTLLGKSNVGMLSRFTERFLLTERPFLWFAIGLIWILLFPAATLTTGELKTRGTYQSEKALLFGSTEVSYDRNDARAAVEIDSRVTKLWQNVSSSSSSYLCESIRDLLAEKQLDAYIYYHNEEECDVYGILRAPRTSGQEAIVLHGMLPNQVRRNVVKKPKNRPSDMSLILSLADVRDWCSSQSSVCVLLYLGHTTFIIYITRKSLEHRQRSTCTLKYYVEHQQVLSKSNWLSKDIIFLFTNKGVERWLDDYNHGSNDFTHRSGIVRKCVLFLFYIYFRTPF